MTLQVHRILQNCCEWIDIDDKVIQNETVRLIQVGLQFSVNYIVQNKMNQQEAWELFFPDVIQKLLVECQMHRKIVAYMVALLYNCVHPQEHLHEELVSSRSLLLTLLHRFFWNQSESIDATGEESEPLIDPAQEWLHIFFRDLYAHGYFKHIYDSIGASLISKLWSRVTPEQLIYLRVMDQLIHAQVSSSNTQENGDCLHDAYDFMINVFKQLIQQSDDDRSEEPEEARKIIWVGLENEAKLVILNIFGQLCQLDQIRSLAISKCLLQLLVNELQRVWEFNPQSTRVNLKRTKANERREPSGYRSHIIAVIGNICYRSRNHQDLLRQLGGIALVLNHCIIDERNPLIREWSLVAVRNICEDNAENQKFIAGLKQQDAALY
ncbi:hypothetical protein ABG067_002378 [Albugo candida]